MARRVGADGSKTAEAIRAAGLRLIFEHGYEGMSLRDLAQVVGIQPGSLPMLCQAIYHDPFHTVVSQGPGRESHFARKSVAVAFCEGAGFAYPLATRPAYTSVPVANWPEAPVANWPRSPRRRPTPSEPTVDGSSGPPE